MASSNRDFQSGMDRSDRFPGRGHHVGFPTRVGITCNADGTPINGVAGYNTGAMFYNFLTTNPKKVAYRNVGTPLSATWIEFSRMFGSGLLVTSLPLTLTETLHSGLLLNVSVAAGGAIMLPPATGTFDVYMFFVGAAITSGSLIVQRGVAADVISGIASVVVSGSSPIGFATAANTNTITLNGSTTGGFLGDYIELQDAGLNQWSLSGCNLQNSGSAATPFSHT